MVNNLLKKYNLAIKNDLTDEEIIEELYNELLLPEPNAERSIPPLLKEGNKFRFEDGVKYYNSEESAMNAIRGFHKYIDKREETSQFIYKKTYDETIEDMTEEEIKEYNRSLSGRHI